ncbi:MAG: response regulator [Chloroflexi bacterium]|nr:response regulator [Chloroflexota bacterium]
MAFRVLVVDDSPFITEVTSGILIGAGYEARAVNDGGAALTAVQEWRPDLMLLDLVMPVKDGWAVLAALRSDPATKSLPVIVITSSHETARERRAQLEAYGAGLLPKPIEAGRLLATVRRTLSAGVPTIG